MLFVCTGNMGTEFFKETKIIMEVYFHSNSEFVIHYLIPGAFSKQEFLSFFPSEIFTESQNHRIVGVGRDLCGSSSPTPLPKQGHLQ